MVSTLCHVVEIGPEKVAWGRGTEQQLPYIASRIGRCECQPLQSVDDADVSILVDVYESFTYEGRASPPYSRRSIVEVQTVPYERIFVGNAVIGSRSGCCLADQSAFLVLIACIAGFEANAAADRRVCTANQAG